MKNIIKFPVTPASEYEALGEIKEPNSAWCTHRRITINKDEREIRCTSCEALIDPFDWALRWVDDRGREMTDLRAMRAERADLRKSLEALKKEEKNTKSRLVNAKKRLAKTEVSQQEIAFAKTSIQKFMESK